MTAQTSTCPRGASALMAAAPFRRPGSSCAARLRAAGTRVAGAVVAPPARLSPAHLSPADRFHAGPGRPASRRRVLLAAPAPTRCPHDRARTVRASAGACRLGARVVSRRRPRGVLLPRSRPRRQ